MNSKKIGILFTIICNIGVIAGILKIGILLSQETLPEIIKKDEFITKMESQDCKVTEEKTNADAEFHLKTEEQCPYQIKYIVFKEKEEKNRFYQETVKIVNENVNVTGYKKVNINEKYLEYATNGEEYKAVIANKNSVLFVTSEKEERINTINLLKDLKYQLEPNIEIIKISWLVMTLLTFICLVSMWKTEKKIRNKGWIAFIPFYNIVVLTKDIMGGASYLLLLIIPGINILFLASLFYKLGRRFNKKRAYCILLVLFPFIVWPLLAFDDSKFFHKTIARETEN